MVFYFYVFDNIKAGAGRLSGSSGSAGEDGVRSLSVHHVQISGRWETINKVEHANSTRKAVGSENKHVHWIKHWEPWRPDHRNQEMSVNKNKNTFLKTGFISTTWKPETLEPIRWFLLDPKQSHQISNIYLISYLTWWDQSSLSQLISGSVVSRGQAWMVIWITWITLSFHHYWTTFLKNINSFFIK